MTSYRAIGNSLFLDAPKSGHATVAGRRSTSSAAPGGLRSEGDGERAVLGFGGDLQDPGDCCEDRSEHGWVDEYLCRTVSAAWPPRGKAAAQDIQRWLPTPSGVTTESPAPTIS